MTVTLSSNFLLLWIVIHIYLGSKSGLNDLSAFTVIGRKNQGPLSWKLVFHLEENVAWRITLLIESPVVGVQGEVSLNISVQWSSKLVTWSMKKMPWKINGRKRSIECWDLPNKTPFSPQSDLRASPMPRLYWGRLPRVLKYRLDMNGAPAHLIQWKLYIWESLWVIPTCSGRQWSCYERE